jgi:SAM-dependent methyltransferase
MSLEMVHRPALLLTLLLGASACISDPVPKPVPAGAADTVALALPPGSPTASGTFAPTPRLAPLGAADTIAPLASPGAPASAFPEPDRPVAKIVDDTWSDERTRDKAGEAERVMSLLGVKEGMHVADIGAGSGYYTVRLSRRVGPAGRVIGQDIVPEYLEGLRRRVRKEGLPNVTLGLGDPHDPRLPPTSLDLALLVHMYHEVEQPYGLLYNLYPALRPGARVAVIDLNRPTSKHGTPPALLRCEFAAVGYTRVAAHSLGKGSGYLAVFEPPATRAELTAPEAMEACAVP